MKNAWETYGAARSGGKLLAVRVENDGARLLVTSLLSSGNHLDHDNLDSGRLFFAVDERLAVVKKVRVRKTSLLETAELVRFELTQTLLDSPESFYFDSLPLDEIEGYRHFLAIAYHRREIDACIDDYSRLLRKPSGFKLDSVALAAGYLTFCRVEPGDLQILLDIGPENVTIAMLHNGRLCSIGRMDAPFASGVTIPEANRLGAELKMKLGYLLAELFDEGITVPVARVILSGPFAHDELLTAALAEHTTAEITRPDFHKGYFQPDAAGARLEEFLIPLGLAVG
ncbi:MAG: hypothetical protein PHR28_01935 [candidate division Zixibacteria bacterium]|nr:hypothetical protein [candidate division Zixibacteria bacterium]